MAADTQRAAVVMPGDDIDPSLVPSHPKKPLKLGPGLRHLPPDALIPTVPGKLVADFRKNSLWVENTGGRYVPTTGDLVIAVVQRSAADYFYASLSPHTPNAALPQLAFESASKKTRPQLPPGSLVYARVAMANRHMDPELECVSPSTGKAEGLGPLAGGMVWPVSLSLARRLLMRRPAEDAGLVVLDELAASGLAFETAVGRNGRVWVGAGASDKDKDAGAARAVLAVGRALAETDEKNLSVDAQKKLAKRLLKELGLV